MLRRIVNEKNLTYPITYNGDNADVGKGLISAIRRKFLLTPKDAILDDDFYGRK